MQHPIDVFAESEEVHARPGGRSRRARRVYPDQWSEMEAGKLTVTGRPRLYV